MATTFLDVKEIATPMQSQVWFADGAAVKEASVPKGQERLFDAACGGTTCCPSNEFSTVLPEYGQMGSIFRISVEDDSSGMGSTERLNFLGIEGKIERVCCSPYPVMNHSNWHIDGQLRSFGIADSQCWIKMQADIAAKKDPSESFRNSIDFGISKMAKFVNHLAWHGRPESGIQGLFSQPGIPAIYLEGLLTMSAAEIQNTLEDVYLSFGRTSAGTNSYANVLVLPMRMKGLLNLAKFTNSEKGGLTAFLENNPQVRLVYEDELMNLEAGCCPCSLGMYFTYFSPLNGDPSRIIRSNPLPIGIFDPTETCDGRIEIKFFAHLGSTWQPRPGDGLKVLVA
jgi:hypothetical protein